MKKTNGPDLRREAVMFALVVVVALVSPLFFDQSPLNWISLLFVVLYVAQRVFHAVALRRAPMQT